MATYTIRGGNRAELRTSTLGWRVYVPKAVTGIVATRNGARTQVDLSWDAMDYATDYLIYRAAGRRDPYSLVRTETGTSWSDTGLDDETDYAYKIVARNFIGTRGPMSNVYFTSGFYTKV